MGILRDLFGPSQAEIWGQLAQRVNGQFVDGGFFGPSAVQARAGEWILTLDTYTVSTGKSSTTYTRMRAPFVNRDGLSLTLYRAGMFSELGKLFGMQDIQIGDPLFDQAFIIQGNYEARIRALLQDSRVRSLFGTQPGIYLTVKPDEGWFFGAQFPEGVDELYFQTHGVIRDLAVLQYLFELFSAVLDRLCYLDSGYQTEEPVVRAIRDLGRPGGQVRSGDLMLWDGDPPRRAAAEELGRLRDRRAVQPLLQVLNDRDQYLRQLAIWSLGQIGDPSAVGAVIPHLGNPYLRATAAETAAALGEGEGSTAFQSVLAGSPEAAGALEGPFRSAWVGALIGALEEPAGLAAGYAGKALAALGAVEGLGEVQKALRRAERGSQLRRLLDEAEDELTRRRALPRPAEPPQPDAATLPRTATGPEAASQEGNA